MAANKIAQYIEKNGLTNTKELLDYAYAIVNKYGEASSALSARMYDTIAEMSGKFLPDAEPAAIGKYGDVAKAINGTLKTSVNPNEIANAAARWVKMAGSDTMLKNAIRDRAEFAWVPQGETCAFCLMLASNGWQPISKKALKNGHAEHIHSNCDCQYMVRFDSSMNVEGYDPEKYREIYNNAEGIHSNEKINAIRKMQYQENKDRINAQKREAYALRNEENNGIFKGAADPRTGKPVTFDENAEYKVNIPQYSDEVNQQISESARSVAKIGSEEKVEYSALVDLETGKQVDFGSDGMPTNVGHYQKYLRDHLEGHYVMIHNHNTESGLSLGDMQELANWNNMDAIVAVTANGITTTVVSNGIKTKDFLEIEFGNIGKGSSRIQKEILQVKAAIEKYSDGGEIIYDGRSK